VQNEQNFWSIYVRCIGPSIAFQTKIPLNELKDVDSFTSSMIDLTLLCGGTIHYTLKDAVGKRFIVRRR
jgi:hypothetical protein